MDLAEIELDNNKLSVRRVRDHTGQWWTRKGECSHCGECCDPCDNWVMKDGKSSCKLQEAVGGKPWYCCLYPVYPMEKLFEHCTYWWEKDES